ncbi:MAG: dienelactone hydrolase family protein [Oscillospiraceae bacterium]
MWNDINTGEYEGMIAETVSYPGHGGRNIKSYVSRPLGAGPYPSIVLIPHMPGWDEWCRETARRFSQHGYVVACPNIYGDFSDGTPADAAAAAREAGGARDDNVMADCEGSINYLKAQPYSNDRVGVIGMCSGGRHAFLAACTVNGFDCAVDCWGGGVVASPESLMPARPVAPIDYTENLSCPLLGIFGNEDRGPSPEEVDILEGELKKYGKDYEFHRYDGAGHGFWYYHNDKYRQKQAMDSLEKVYAFFEKHLR